MSATGLLQASYRIIGRKQPDYRNYNAAVIGLQRLCNGIYNGVVIGLQSLCNSCNRRRSDPNCVKLPKTICRLNFSLYLCREFKLVDFFVMRLWILFLLAMHGIVINANANNMARPWTFWYWMYGAVSKAAIKADLQAMKDVGLGGCYLMPIRGVTEKPEFEGKAQQLTPEFFHLMDYAMQQANSLGLELGLHICDGFALAGGPWITPEESMQQVIWTDTIVVNPQSNGQLLPMAPKGYDGYYEDIAAFAVRLPDDCANPLPAPKEQGTIKRDEQGVFRSKEPGYIQFDFDTPVTVRSLEVIPSGNNLQSQRLLLQASTDGVAYHDVRQLAPPRQGWQNTGQNYTYALPETSARSFRFTWTPEGTEPGSEDLDAAKWSPVLKIKELRLSPLPVIDQYESKNGSVWRIPSCQWDNTNGMTLKATRLPAKLSPGVYRILRLGHTSTGQRNATAGGGMGLECDKFSISSVNKQLDGWFGQLMKMPHSNVVKYMHVDSWECGSQNWSRTFADEFQRRRGYDLLPFMPVFAGVPVENSEQVLHDVRLTINDLIQEAFFATVKRRATEHGVQLSAECVAPTMVSDGLAHYKYADLPMGEFWLNSPTHDKPNDMLDAISGAHIYGKPLIQAEGFTEVRGVWDETPALIKPLLDRNFTLGINRLFFHVFAHNPWLDRKPGMTLDGIGLFFQRDQTWFPEAKALVDYVTRCQTLLQQGTPVVDIAVFTGEEMPRRALTPDKLVPMLPGLFGPERVASERERLANHGSPMVESPVGVRHNANILDLKDWVNALHGYHYDSMNEEALMAYAPKTQTNSPSYRVLVIPEGEGSSLSPETKARIDDLRQQGMTIIDNPCTQSVIEGLQPDIVLPDGIAFTHRATGKKDIYFLSNQTAATQTFTPTFRACSHEDLTSRNAMTYDPMTDRYNAFLGRVSLKPYASVFVIFGDDSRFFPIPVTTCLHQRIPRNKMKWKQRGGWDVSFRESGLTLHTDTLFDWSRQTADSIRFYSGHARYRTTIQYKGKEVTGLKLCLGDVHDVAHVWVNGQDCGIAWMPPYEVDVTRAMKNGKNTIEIEVVNTWHNALRGADQGTPPYPGIWTNARYRTKGDSLLPAGLLGPMELRIEAHTR